MKGAALMMDAPEPSEVTIVRGPETRSAGTAVNPPRPPAITSALMQRRVVGVGVGVGVCVSDAVAVLDNVEVILGVTVAALERLRVDVAVLEGVDGGVPSGVVAAALREPVGEGVEEDEGVLRSDGATCVAEEVSAGVVVDVTVLDAADVDEDVGSAVAVEDDEDNPVEVPDPVLVMVADLVELALVVAAAEDVLLLDGVLVMEAVTGGDAVLEGVISLIHHEALVTARALSTPLIARTPIVNRCRPEVPST